MSNSNNDGEALWQELAENRRTSHNIWQNCDGAPEIQLLNIGPRGALLLRFGEDVGWVYGDCVLEVMNADTWDPDCKAAKQMALAGNTWMAYLKNGSKFWLPGGREGREAHFAALSAAIGRKKKPAAATQNFTTGKE